MYSSVYSMARLSMVKASAWFAVFFIPFISFPVMPSTYRPVSVYFLLLPSLMFLLNYRTFFNRQDRVLSILILFAIFYGFFVGLVSSDFSFLGYFSELITIAIGVLVYAGFRFIFQTYGMAWFFRVSAISYKFVVVLGCLEILSLLGVLPYSVKELINFTLSGKSHGRIQLTTMEAAWGARVFLFLFIAYIFSLNDSGVTRKIYIVLGLILFLSTFSMAMFSYFSLGMIFYFILKYRFKAVFYLLLLLGLGYFLILGMLGVFDMMGIGGYHLNRVEALIYGDFYQFEDMLHYDQSIFIRLGYPVLAVYIYMDNLMGIGLGQYSLYFNEYLIEYFGASVLSFPEVLGDVYTSDGDPRSLPAKLLSELSVVGLSLYFYLFYVCFSTMNRDYNTFKILFICVAFASSFTIGTWAYMYVWVALAMMPASREGK